MIKAKNRQNRLNVMLVIALCFALFTAYQTGVITLPRQYYEVITQDSAREHVGPIAVPLDRSRDENNGLVVCINFLVANCLDVQAKALSKGRPYKFAEGCWNKFVDETKTHAQIVFLDGNLQTPHGSDLKPIECAVSYKEANPRVCNCGSFNL